MDKIAMNVKEMAGLVGKTYIATMGTTPKLFVRCNILDVRVSYGTVQVYITPQQGSGACWVIYNEDNLEAQ